MKWTVETAPKTIKFIVSIYGLIGACLLWFILALWRQTIKYRVTGDGDRRIEALWHHNLILYFMFYSKTKQKSCWMQHPALYMKPTHYLLKWMGVDRLAFGSTGNAGKAALEEIISLLLKDYKTVITPDGPAGPPLTAKKGVFLLSAKTDLPVTAVAFHCSKPMRLPTWDRKILPWPFSTVRIHFHSSLNICHKNHDTFSHQLSHI